MMSMSMMTMPDMPWMPWAMMMVILGCPMSGWVNWGLLAAGAKYLRCKEAEIAEALWQCRGWGLEKSNYNYCTAQCVVCKVRCHCIFYGPGIRYSDIFGAPGIRYSVIIKSWPCICYRTIMPLNWKQHHTLIYILSTLKPLMYSATRTQEVIIKWE